LNDPTLAVCARLLTIEIFLTRNIGLRQTQRARAAQDVSKFQFPGLPGPKRAQQGPAAGDCGTRPTPPARRQSCLSEIIDRAPKEVIEILRTKVRNAPDELVSSATIRKPCHHHSSRTPASGRACGAPPAHPVAFMTAATVVPWRRWSISITRACFESLRLGLADRSGASSLAFLRRAAATRREGLSGARSTPCSVSRGSSASGGAPPSSPGWPQGRVWWCSASGPCHRHGATPAARRALGFLRLIHRSGVCRPLCGRRRPSAWAQVPMAQSSRCEAADRSTSWVSVSFIAGIEPLFQP
jgi:hypothetical protein